MNVRQIVIDYLKAHGCDGLCADGCRYGCELNGLGECFCGITEVCQPAKLVDGKLKPVEVPQEKDGELSAGGAIRVQCYHCMGWNVADAKKCTTKACPLWSYSPATKAISEYRKGQVKKPFVGNFNK